MARRSPFPVWSIVPTSGWFVLLGIWFGATHRSLLLWLAIPVGSLAQSVGYFVFVESTAASYAPEADLATGLGAAFLTIPIFLAVLILIWVVAALGGSAAELRKRTVTRRLT